MVPTEYGVWNGPRRESYSIHIEYRANRLILMIYIIIIIMLLLRFNLSHSI